MSNYYQVRVADFTYGESGRALVNQNPGAVRRIVENPANAVLTYTSDEDVAVGAVVAVPYGPERTVLGMVLGYADPAEVSALVSRRVVFRDIIETVGGVR